MEEEEKETDIEHQIIPQEFEPETSWLCCTTYRDRSKFKSIMQYLKLSTVQKQIIEIRYLRILESLQKRVRNYAFVYYIGNFLITIGSLFIPALLSIQNTDRAFALTSGPFNVHMYWATFVVSLIVTICNAILSLFSINKKYFLINTILERLRSEGWQYLALTGRYSGHLTSEKPTHDNQFVHFTNYIEKIRLKQIEEEFDKTDEKSQMPNKGAGTGTGIGLGTGTGTGIGKGIGIGTGTGKGNQVILPVGESDWDYPSPNKSISDKSMPTTTQNYIPEPIRNAYQNRVRQSALMSTTSIPTVYLNHPSVLPSPPLTSPAPLTPPAPPLTPPAPPAPVAPAPAVPVAPAPSPAPSPAYDSPSHSLSRYSAPVPSVDAAPTRLSSSASASAILITPQFRINFRDIPK